MTLKNAVTFQWGFEESQTKGDQTDPRNKFLQTKSSSDKRMSTHETSEANSVLHSSLSTVQGGQRLRYLPSKRFKGTWAARESVSHKPYATSCLWKPSDKGMADTSRKTFLTLAPVFSSSSVKKGQVQPKGSVVPLISMTPPLKMETLPHQPVPSDSRGESLNGTAPHDLIHHNRGSVETGEKERIHEDLQPNISFRCKEELRDPSGDKYDDHAFCYTHDDCVMIGHDNTFGNHSDFSKLSRLPAIKPWSHDPDKNDIETASLESYKPLPYEFENPWKSLAHQENLPLTHELWENPKLLRKDTLLDSISDKNLIDQKTLFSKKVDASYSRITHENTVILPPVECNRRQRDVLADSSFLTEKQYVRDVLENQRKVFHIHQKQDQIPETVMPRRRSLELHVQEPEFVSQPKQITKQNRSKNGKGAKDVRDFTHNKRNTLANERFFKADAFFSSHLPSGNDILTSESDSLLHQSKAFNSRPILTEHLKKSPSLKRGVNTNTVMQNEKARNRLITNTACVDFNNGDIHSNDNINDWKCSMAYTNTNSDNHPIKQTQFRLPAKYPPHANNGTVHICPECSKGHSVSNSNRSVRENQDYSLPSQNSLFENQSHVSTHFCDVLGKHTCSQCREQKARRLRGQVNGSVAAEEKVTVAGLRRNGIMSPPPVPSPSPTFLPVQALHKVIIRVKDKQGITSVTSVGVNEDVIRRTTA